MYVKYINQKRKFRDVDLLRTFCGEECHRAWADVTSISPCTLYFPRGNRLKVTIYGCVAHNVLVKSHGDIICVPWNVSLSGWDRHTSPLIYPGLLLCSNASLFLAVFLPDIPVMTLPAVLAVALLGLQAGALPDRDDPAILRRACPDYTSYASTPQ